MDDQNDDLSFWKTKYSLLEEQYSQVKQRNEDLEDRILDMVEKIEGDKITLSTEIDQLTTKLERTEDKLKKYEALALNYGYKIPEEKDINESEMNSILESLVSETPDDPVIVKNKIFAPIKLKGESSTDLPGYRHIPILSLEEGFIYGFRWTKECIVKVV